MKRYIFSLILLGAIFLFAHPSWGADTELFTTQARPNILIIFDNSNSMDEDFLGNAAGSFKSDSKAVHGKNALRDIIEQYKYKLRFGLLTYKLPSGVASYNLHNSPYFVSYDPKSYCPNPPPECITYAQTGEAGAKSVCNTKCQEGNPSFDAIYLDEIINNYPVGSEQRNRYSKLIFSKRQMKSASPNSTIYYKNAYPFYSPSNQGTAFCYSGGYSPNEGVSWDSYSCYTSKTGTNDDNANYSGLFYSGQLSPTDSDYALGYLDFGRRLQWNYVSKTWFSNSSPGGGYLDVGVDYLTDKKGDPTSTYTTLMNKLDPKENNEAGYMGCGATDKNTCAYVVNAGLTPTAGTFETAAKYFKGEAGYTSPIEDWCQKSFIIYVTDGLPSVNESGTPQSADTLMPTVLTKIENLRNITKTLKGKDYNFEIKTYVLGVGLSDEAKPKLDDMASKGGTAEENSGKAYYADNPQQLIGAMEKIFKSIIECPYSFASPSIPSVRMVDGAILYLSSFTPIDKSPFWPGNLEAYKLKDDGTLEVKIDKKPLNAPIWNAGEKLRDMSHDARKIYTYVRGAKREFTAGNITPGDLGVDTAPDPNAARDAIVNYIRGNALDTYDIDMDLNKTEQRPWKLGDIFHSNTVIVGSPSPFFTDTGYSGAGGFYENNKSRKRVVIVGANDGMLHAFDGGDWVWDDVDKKYKYTDGTGDELWSFIPNILLKNLKSTLTTYTYYVDSSPKVADVWIGDSNSNGIKDPNEWRTVLVCGLRRGGKHYFALDITDNLNPKHLWEFSTSGESWSEPAIGRVKIEQGGNLVEKWVAFIGGGFDPTEKIGKDADIGRSFFVIDITNGNIIWEFSYDKDDDKKKFMKHSLAAPPTAVDTNMDGYVDKVYIGDLGGQMWVFDVSFNETTKKSDSQWYEKAYRLFQAPGSPSEKHKIYYQPAVAFDKNRKPWVFFGTGDREDPKDWSNPKERFYAVQDDGSGNYPKKEGTDLKDVTSSANNTFVPDPTKKGWFIILDKDGKSLEKVIAKPSVFNQLVYFSTYTNIETSDICAVEGISKEYIIYYLSGGGAIDVDDFSDFLGTPSSRSRQIGEGAPSPPVISVNIKGKASVIIGTTSGQIYSEQAFSPSTNKPLLYWREVIP